MPVSVRTRLPAASASRKRRFMNALVVFSTRASSYARFTWPWISASPMIIASRPAVTRNRWRAARPLRSE